LKLQTQIPLGKQSNNLIDYNSNILLLGSCFVENIGDKLEYFKFQTLQNPFGILFHPKAIEKLILNAIHKKKYTEDDVFHHNGQWHCYDAHSKLSSPDKELLLSALNKNLDLTTKQLCNATHIIITLGTAWVYRHYKSNLPVANCHKVPQKEFVKELLSVEEVTNSLKLIVNHIHQENPNATIIFTVSPVRHIKDGFVENTQSKAHLIAGIQSILNRNSFYFPSYEIMMDELRDYRFYAEDMLHPNMTAINYIWEKFKFVWISKDAYKIMDEVDGIQKGLHHKPFNPQDDTYQLFLNKLQGKITLLQSQFSHIKF
jgi:hypothetical protein